MKNLIYFLKFEKKSKIIYLIFLLLFGTSLDLFGLSMIVPIINVVANFDKLQNIISNYNILAPLYNFNQTELIILFLVFFLIINVFKGIVFVYLNWKTNQFSKDINLKMSEKLIDHYSKIKYEEMINKSSGTLIRNISEEILGVSNSVLNLLNLFVELVVIFFIFSFVLIVEPNGLLIITFFLISGLYIFRKILTKKLILWGENRQKYFLKRISNISELFHSYPELKLLNKINFFGALYLKYNNNYYTNQIKYNVAQIVPRFLIESLAVLGLMFALIYLIIIENNQEQILYSLAILGASALRVLPTMSRIINYYNSLKFSTASIDLIKDELESLQKEDVIQENQFSLNFSKNILLKNLSYKYSNKDLNILNNINLEIFKNEIIGIKGITGSGKSTLLKIILGLLKPNNGEILVDGIDIHKKKYIDSWYTKVAYVPQNIYLLNDSIKKNVLLGVNIENENNENYKKALKVSLSDEFINKIKNLDQTIVGENGIKLSGGQKQRLGIARALYQKKEILILDEATNSLDEETEKKILDGILKMQNKPTIIFVSHKSANFDICDKIIDISKINS